MKPQEYMAHKVKIRWVVGLQLNSAEYLDLNDRNKKGCLLRWKKTYYQAYNENEMLRGRRRVSKRERY